MNIFGKLLINVEAMHPFLLSGGPGNNPDWILLLTPFILLVGIIKGGELLYNWGKNWLHHRRAKHTDVMH